MKNEANVDELAKLCHIKCSEQEKEKIQANLEKVLGYVSLLNEVETKDVPPCMHVLETMINVMEDDEPRNGEKMSREDFLKNAPDQVGGMIKVPTVIEFKE